MTRSRQLAAIMFTDIEGYTALMQKNEQKATQVRDKHRRIFNSTTAKHLGRILQYYGDGTLSIFDSAIEAVDCAIEMQLDFQKDPAIPIRIGIHIGDILFSKEEIIGDGVNIASRIESLAVPGSVFISEKVYDEIKNQESIKTTMLKTFKLKNVEKPIGVYAISNEGLIVPNPENIKGKTDPDQSSLTEKQQKIKPQFSNRLNKIIIVVMCIAIALLGINMFYIKQSTAVDKNEGANITNNVMEKSIAVLAFADMSPEKDQEYFSDGISEEILNLLSKISELKVISRTSSFSYKGKEQNIKKIAEELQVTHVLEGSIRKSGNKFRITTQLINAADGAHMWGETYDRNMEDIFKIQDEISAKVTQQLKITILGDVVTTKETNIEAYNLYLQAKQIRQISYDNNEIAEKLIRQSIDIDGNYAPSWVLLSEIIFQSTNNFSRRTILDGITTGKATINKALDLDGQDAFAYATLADYNQMEWDFESATRNINKALKLAPNNAEIMRRAAGMDVNLGNQDAAITMLNKAIILDPLNYIIYFNLAFFYSWNEQYDEAEANLQKYLAKYPDSVSGRNYMVALLLAKGNAGQALVEIEKENIPFWSLYRKSMVVYALGRTDEANNLLKQLVNEFGLIAWPNIAHVYAYRGEKDEAFKWLEMAFDNRDASLLEILNYPELKNLYGDPRWNTFINKLGLPKDHSFHLD